MAIANLESTRADLDAQHAAETAHLQSIHQKALEAIQQSYGELLTNQEKDFSRLDVEYKASQHALNTVLEEYKSLKITISELKRQNSNLKKNIQNLNQNMNI